MTKRRKSRAPKQRSKVANKIAAFRQTLKLSQRALAALVGTSQQQIDRIEKGQETGPGIAFAIARALQRRADEVFPDLAGLAQAKSDAERAELFRQAGFESRNLPPTCHLRFEMAGFTEPFIYLVDPQDAERVAESL